MKNVNWNKLLKVLIAVLTAVAGSLGIVSCMRQKPLPPPSPEGRELAVIVENVIPPNYAEAIPFRKV